MLKRVPHYYLILGIIILCYSVIILSYSTYFPAWDSLNYITKIMDGISKPFNFFNFEEFGHPSEAYLLILALPQYFSPYNIRLLHTTNMFFSITAIFFFWKILRYIFGDENMAEMLIITGLFAFFPPFVANAIYITPDYGVFIYFLPCMYFILNRKYLPALIFGTGMVLSKETGAIIYIQMVFILFLFELFKNHLKIFSRKTVKKYLFLFIPGYSLLIYYVAKYLFSNSQTVFWIWWDKLFSPTASWTGNYPGWNPARIPAAYLIGIFIINFIWIITVTNILGFLAVVWRKTMRKSVLPSIRKEAFIYILLLMPCIYLTVTYIKSFLNIRYFITLYPLFLICFCFSSLLIKNKITRIAFLSATLAVFVIANFFTYDPVSIKVFGTFKFGNHNILAVNSYTGECCGYGRDQLVYNLQFTNISFILDNIFHDLNPDQNMYVATDIQAGDLMVQPLEKNSLRRSFHGKREIFALKDFTWDFLHKDLATPEEIYYFKFPFAMESDNLPAYLKIYSVAEEKQYKRNGYGITVYKMVKKKA